MVPGEMISSSRSSQRSMMWK